MTLDYLKFDIAGWRRHTDDKDENIKEVKIRGIIMYKVDKNG